jgi:hypothetical protein
VDALLGRMKVGGHGGWWIILTCLQSARRYHAELMEHLDATARLFTPRSFYAITSGVVVPLARDSINAFFPAVA